MMTEVKKTKTKKRRRRKRNCDNRAAEYANRMTARRTDVSTPLAN